MIKNAGLKFLISICILLQGLNAYASTYVSLSPSVTEVIYALNAQDNLLGVSKNCNYPQAVKEKPVIGDNFYVNMEMLVKLKPDYIFAMTSAKPKMGEIALTKTKPVYIEYSSIEEIYKSIRYIAELTEAKTDAQSLINSIKQKIEDSKTKNPKRILYLVQTNPMITTGSKSFITDIIRKSGHIAVTEDIPYYYPGITFEYAIKTNPDIIICGFYSDTSTLKRLFPNAKILYLDEKQLDIINRGGPRVYEAVKLFSELNFSSSPIR